MFEKRLYKNITLLLAAFSCLLLVACNQAFAPKFNNVDITGASNFGTNFELTDHHGQVRHLDDFKGKVVVMFFGYTQCPDVCPTTMVEMQGVMNLLGSKADQVQVIFVTLDPERDTQDILAEYVPAFGATFLGLRPQTPEALQKITKDFKVFYQKVPGSKGSYTIDHTAGSYVFDKEGHIRLFVKHGQGVQPLADDLKILLD